MNIAYKLIDASQIENFHRPYWWTIFGGDTDKSVLPYDIKILRSHARRLYGNVGPLRVAIQEKAMYCVGRHWDASYEGADVAFGAQAEAWLADNWYPMCDVAGPEFDFKLVLYLLSVNLDVYGEFFIYLTEQENGYPAIQRIPAHRIDQPRQSGALGSDLRLTGDCFNGAFKGFKCTFGVVSNEQGRPLAYSVIGNTEDQDALIPADDMIRVREIDLGDETRSIPTFSHGINQGRSILSLLGNEQEFLESASKIALIETNSLGGIDINDPTNALALMPSPPTDVGDGATNPGSVVNGVNRQFAEEWRQSGETRYFKSGTGSSLQAFQFERPADSWGKFMDKLTRFMIDPIWPFYLVDREWELTGATCRGLLARTNRIIQDRQDVILRVARKIVQYAVAKGAKIGRISQSNDWYNWGFTKPAKITADFGRDSKAEVMEMDAGVLDPAEIVEARGGGTYRQWLEQTFRNQALKKQILRQVEAETGEDLTPPVQQPISGSTGSDEVDS
jgi:hypothetical protein